MRTSWYIYKWSFKLRKIAKSTRFDRVSCLLQSIALFKPIDASESNSASDLGQWFGVKNEILSEGSHARIENFDIKQCIGQKSYDLKWRESKRKTYKCLAGAQTSK